MKICRLCNIEKHTNEFTKNGKFIRTECTLCFNKLMRNNYHEKSLEYKNRQLINRYGLSIGEYNKLLVQQNNSCAICKTNQTDITKALAVDHCHKTRKVRGLLCENCNRGLGLFQDDPDLLNKASDYLRDEGNVTH